MFHKPKFFKKMKRPHPTERQDEKPSVTLETAERLAHEAYTKAFADAKSLFDSSLQIDQKMSAGIEQVNRRWKWYATLIGLFATIISAIISIAGVLGLRSLVHQYISDVGKTVSERFVSKEISKQLKQYSDDNVAPLIQASLKETEEEIKTELEQIKDDTAELQTAILSARKEMSELSAGLLESRNMLDVHEKIAAARAGNRIAYDALHRIAKGSDHNAHVAKLGIDGIDKAYELRKHSLVSRVGLINSRTGNATTTPEEAMLLVYTQDGGLCEGALNHLSDQNQMKYAATFVHAVSHSGHLDCVYAGILGIEKVSGQKFSALGINDVLEWWDEHKEDAKYHYGFEKICEAIAQLDESDESYQWQQILLLKKWIDEKADQYWVAEHMMNLLLNDWKDQDGERKKMMEHVLEYWEGEHPRQDTWYLAKTMYLTIYDSGKVVDFVNARLAEQPSFEDNLRRFENSFFTKQFFQINQINWPSKVAKQLEESRPNADKATE